MRATGVLKIKRYPDASFYKGQFLSGSNSCPAAFCMLVSGDSFICSAVPLNGMAFKCTISVNENLN